MKVTNNAQQQIEVAINQWGNDGDTSFFALDPGGSDSWDRSDKRGFVMVVKKTGAQRPYYIQYNSDIIVSDDKVTDHGSIINPIS
jgi:hypothetical protein